MATALEREIRIKLEDTTAMMLRGDAKDYAAYASVVARYRVLKELVDFTDERRKALQTGDVIDDE